MIEIVKMTQAHVPQIAQLEAMYFSDPWSEKSIAEELNNELAVWLVATDGNQVAGYIGSQSVLGEADVMNVAVAPGYRRQGIGQLLVQNLIEELSRQRVHCLTLEVRVSNQAANALYQKLGFEQIGRRPKYYEKPKEDALILRKDWGK